MTNPEIIKFLEQHNILKTDGFKNLDIEYIHPFGEIIQDFLFKELEHKEGIYSAFEDITWFCDHMVKSYCKKMLLSDTATFNINDIYFMVNRAIALYFEVKSRNMFIWDLKSLYQKD